MKTAIALVICLILLPGCLQPAGPPAITVSPVDGTPGITVPENHITATAQKIDSTRILVIYNGGPDADHLIELETAIINNKGSVIIQSMGSRLDTTPVKSGGTDMIKGPFSGQVHVIITGYYFNGTHQDILETWIQ
jgi:hypothetical protein